MKSFFRQLFDGFWANLGSILAPRRWIWFALAIVLTYVFVIGGLDWWWYVHAHVSGLWVWVFPAIVLGTFVPVVVPVWLLFRRRAALGYALGQAAFMGWALSSVLKVFTGRIPPDMAAALGPDISNGFRFGFLRGGIFWGWPSSHTMIAFSMAAALVALYPRSRGVRFLAPLYALWIGLSVSISIHWFSEFVAGAILGWLCGWVVGTAARKRLTA